MGIELAIGGLIAAVGAATTIYTANKQEAAQRDAARQAEESAKRQAEQQRQETRRQNAQQADVSGILQQNAANAGGGTTLLTGAGGVNRNDLNLGQGNTLG